MLSRRFRLTKSEDFQAAKRAGQHFRSDLISLNIRRNHLLHNRFGFVVSRQVGGAAQRNLVKRRLRNSARQWIPDLEEGYDIVVIAHPPAASTSYNELHAHLGQMLIRAHLADGHAL
nr:ribonuclease P protein component [Anaerolineae bacterium]